MTDYSAEQLRRAKDQLPHGARCPAPDLVARADRITGRPMILCLGCHHHEFIDALVEQVRAAKPGAYRLYVCPAHQNQNVNARGKGCPTCRAEMEARRRPRPDPDPHAALAWTE